MGHPLWIECGRPRDNVLQLSRRLPPLRPKLLEASASEPPCSVRCRKQRCNPKARDSPHVRRRWGPEEVLVVAEPYPYTLRRDNLRFLRWKVAGNSGPAPAEASRY